MNGAIVRRPAAPAADLPYGLLVKIALAVFFMLLLGWATKSIMSIQPQPVPLVPCKRCASQCPCPRMSGAIRCGCPD